MKRALATSAATLGLATAAAFAGAAPAQAVGPLPCGDYPAGAPYEVYAAPTTIRVHYAARVVLGAFVSRNGEACEGYATSLRVTPNLGEDAASVRTTSNGGAYYVLTIRRNFNFKMALKFRVIRLSNYGTVRIG